MAETTLPFVSGGFQASFGVKMKRSSERESACGPWGLPCEEGGYPLPCYGGSLGRPTRRSILRWFNRRKSSLNPVRPNTRPAHPQIYPDMV